MDVSQWTRWTAWPSLVCYVVALGLRVGPRSTDWKSVATTFSFWGWLLLVAHVLFAMGFVHSWSLAEAYAHTSRQTAAVTGWTWGGGVYFNFLTLIIWGWSVVVQMLPAASKMLQLTEVIAQGYLAFMMFNATVVFGSRPAQLAGALACVLLLWWYGTPERPS